MTRPWIDRIRGGVSRIHPSVLFAAGVTWDWLTLDIDSWVDNGLIAVAFACLFAVFVLEGRIEGGRSVPAWAAAHPDRLHLAEQFVLGALLSAFWVQIMRSSSSTSGSGSIRSTPPGRPATPSRSRCTAATASAPGRPSATCAQAAGGCGC